MLQTWRVVLNRLRVNDANEEGPFSDGDEPQLAVIAFRSTYGRAGSTDVWRQPFDSGLWPEGVVQGATIDIPAQVGVFEFPPISSPWALGRDAEVFGFAVVAFERDATPQALIRDKLDDTVEALHAGLAGLVEGRQLVWWIPDEANRQIAELNTAVAAAGTFSGIEELGVFAGSALDSDEHIGGAQIVFSNLTTAPAGLEFAAARAVTMELVSQRYDTSYTVTGWIEIASEELEFMPDTSDAECRPLAWSPVSLPVLIETVKHGGRAQVEIKLDDTVNPTRTAFGTNLTYLPGEHSEGSFPFSPPGHVGEKLVMDTVECQHGRRTDDRWRAELLLSRDSNTAFGDSSYPSMLIYINDVHVYYQPLQQVGTLWEGSDPSSRIQVLCRRYEPPH